TAADIQVLMTALTNINAYQTSHGFSNSQLLAVADVNGDHLVTNTDLQALLSKLATDVQPPILPVPEPPGMLLIAIGTSAVFLIHRRRAVSTCCVWRSCVRGSET